MIKANVIIVWIRLFFLNPELILAIIKPTNDAASIDDEDLIPQEKLRKKDTNKDELDGDY